MNYEFEMPAMSIISTSPDLRESTIEFSGVAETMGHTLGNGLRRALLSSIPGMAPVAFTILGTEKEFSDVPGLVDNTTEMALKIKNLKVSTVIENDGVNTETLPKFLLLSLDKDYENESIKFGDFVLDNSVEQGTRISILNPDEELTYVGKKRTISIKLLLWLGAGYATYDEVTKGYEKEVTTYLGNNAIFLDSDFSPIERVIYKVEEDSPSKGLETLRITVTTNGYIPAITALSQASGILSSTFYMIQSLTSFITKPHTVAVESKELDSKSDRPSDMNLATPIEKFGLSTELYNKLKHSGINNMGDLNESTDPTGEMKILLSREIMNIRPELILETHAHILQNANITTVEDLIRTETHTEYREEMLKSLESMGLKIHEE